MAGPEDRFWSLPAWESRMVGQPGHPQSVVPPSGESCPLSLGIFYSHALTTGGLWVPEHFHPHRWFRLWPKEVLWGMLTGLPAKTKRFHRQIPFGNAGLNKPNDFLHRKTPQSLKYRNVRLQVREGVCSASQTFPFFLKQAVTSHFTSYSMHSWGDGGSKERALGLGVAPAPPPPETHCGSLPCFLPMGLSLPICEM